MELPFLKPVGNTPWKFVNFGVNYTNQNLEEYIETQPILAINFKIAIWLIPMEILLQELFTSLGHAYDRTGNLPI